METEKFGMLVEPLYYSEAATSYSTAYESAKSSGAFSNFRQKETPNQSTNTMLILKMSE